MIRRTTLLLFAAAIGTAVAAQEKYVIFNTSDGFANCTPFTSIDSAAFQQAGTVASFYMNNGRTARYAVSSIASIDFEATAGKATDFPSDFSGYMNAEPVFSDAAEPARPTDENDPAYGDFIENFQAKTTLTFIYSGSSVSVTGSRPEGVTIEKNGAHVVVKSTKKGMTYRLQGSTTNGSFKVANMNKSETDDNNKKFVIELNGVNITNPSGPAINVQSGKSVYLKLTAGKANTLKDGTTYSNSAESQKGTLFSEGQLLVSGGGSLSVVSLGGHGICSDDYVILRKGTGNITITSLKDGIATNDKFIMYGGNVTITAQDDGISVSRGPLEIYGGNLTVNSVDEGLTSEYLKSDTTCVTVAGGRIDITTTGAKGHALYSTGKVSIRGGALTATVAGDASKCINAAGDITVSKAWARLLSSGKPLYDDEELDYSSAAAIRARQNLVISESVIAMSCTGNGSKCINATGSVSIDGSTVTALSQGQDYTQNSQSIRSRALDSGSLTIGNGTLLNIDAAQTAIYTESGLTVAGGHTHAYTSSPEAKCLNAKGSFTISGGMILFGRKNY